MVDFSLVRRKSLIVDMQGDSRPFSKNSLASPAKQRKNPTQSRFFHIQIAVAVSKITWK